MKLSDKQKLFTGHVAQLIEFAIHNEFQLTFGEVWRTIEQQKIYFDTGRSKTMDSRHLQRLAVDFNIWFENRMLFQDSSRYIEDLEVVRPLGDYWCGLDTFNVWGGDWNRNRVLDETFRDPYHFERVP